MNILFISNHAGFSKFNAPYINALSSCGFRVYNASPGLEINCNCIHYDVPITRSPITLGNLFSFFKLIKIIYAQNIKIVHCHTPSGGVLGRLLKITKPSVRVIYTAHGFHFYKGSPLINWFIFFPIEYILSFLTDAIITINREDFTLAKNNLNCQIFHIDGVGVNLTRFHPDDSAYTSGRKLLKIKDTTIVFIYVSQFINRKNHRLLIESFIKLLKLNPDSLLLLVGTGPNMESIKQLVIDFELENHITFLGYRTDVEKLYQLSNVLVSTSTQEGFPINLVEGLASGLPLVVSDIRGHRDIVAKAPNNFMVTDYSDNEFSMKMYDAGKMVFGKYFSNSVYVDSAMNFDINNSLLQMSKIYSEVLNTYVNLLGNKAD